MSEPMSFICEPGPEWIQQISGWIWVCYPNVSFPHTCKRTWATYTGKLLNMDSSTPVLNQREVNIVSAATLLRLRGTHWHATSSFVCYCSRALTNSKLWAGINLTDYSSSRGPVMAELKQEPGGRKLSRTMEEWMFLTVLLCGSLSLLFFIQARNHLHRVVPHIVGWPLPHQIVNQEDSHTGLLPELSHGGGFFSVDGLSSQISPACVKLTKT